MEAGDATRFSGRTAWARSLETPLSSFLRTETGSATILLGAAVVALIWANASASSYQGVWDTTLSIRIGDAGISQTLGHWINSGLMTFFFFVIGLEARREFDLGELRDREMIALPVLAGLAGMAATAAIFLAINSGQDSAQGWGVAMSTDTAFALGALAVVGPRFSDRLRAFILTVSVIDDLAALVVIATVYADAIHLGALLVGVGVFGIMAAAARLRIGSGPFYLALGIVAWVALFKSGVDPIVIGLAMGLLTYAAPAERGDLEEATDLFRRFREQPTPELARSAAVGLQSAVSPNERLQFRFHPWTSYVIVPLFALANAGIVISGDLLSRAITSPITLGIVVGYVAGKPLGIGGAAWVLRRLTRGRVTPPVGWSAVIGAGAAAGIGFTISLLIAALAFGGTDLEEAKVGILAGAVGATLLSAAVYRITQLLPRRLRMRAMYGPPETIVDLAVPVDPEVDHMRGPKEATVTIVEYGDFECPYCGRAESVIRELLADYGDIAYVWRHLPLTDVHLHAQLAAEASEAAHRQGRFWDMHDLLLDHQDALRPKDLIRHAEELGLDADRFENDLREHRTSARVARDVDSADLSGVSGTPTFFVNGRRHYGPYDIDTLSKVVRLAGARVEAAAA
ncbi:MAG: Na+/H+ antiporter NhaA [Solirubrobacterales bacterium]